MKTPEDEAFEDIERRQGGGFPAKRAMAADKLYHSTEARWCENFVEVKHPHIENEIVRFYFTQPVQRPWVELTLDEIEELFQNAAGADEERDIRFARLIEANSRRRTHD